MKKIVFVSMALLLLLTGCTQYTQASVPTESFTQGLYEFTLAVEQIAGDPTDAWEFVYTYNDAIIAGGYQFLFPLGIFTFHSIQVDIHEKTVPSNTYSTTFRVAICNGGSGRTEVTVTGADGKTATFVIACQVLLVSKE